MNDPVSFVSDFRYVDHPFETLGAALSDPSNAWLQALAGAHPGADRRASTGVVRVGTGPDRARIPVLVSLGGIRQRDGEIVLPLTWEPLQLERLLPSLDADLMLTRVADSSCRLGLTGRYRAPMARIGQRLDRLGMHGLAESSVRRFLEDVESSLVTPRPFAAGRP